MHRTEATQRSLALLLDETKELIGFSPGSAVWTTVSWLCIHRRAIEVEYSACGYRQGLTVGRSGDQVGCQSDTTVCKTVSASPVTCVVIGSPPGTTREDLRARVAWQESSKPPR